MCSRQNLSQRFAKHPAVLLKETSNGSSQNVYEMDQSDISQMTRMALLRWSRGEGVSPRSLRSQR